MLALAWVVAVVGCAPAGAPPPQALVVGQLGRIESVNEILGGNDEHNRALSRLLFLPLLEERPDFAAGPPTYEPRLAESWNRSDDGTVLTFRLRPDLQWSDGAPLTAEDVRFTWLAQTSPEIGWTLAPSANLLHVEAADPRTVRFRFERGSADQLSDALASGVLPAHVWSRLPFSDWRANPHWFAEHLVVSGPYTVADFAADRVELAANPRYYLSGSGLPRLQRVALQFVTDQVALLAMLRAGEAGFVSPVSSRDRRRLESLPEVQTLDYPTRQVTFLSWNLERPQFADTSVRRALGLAIDRAEIVHTLWFDAAVVGCSPIPASVWARDATLEPLAHDPAAALELLAGAGWRDTDGDGLLDRDGLTFRFEVLTNTGNEQRWDALQMIRADLAEIGIEAVPRRLEIQAVGAALLEQRYDAALTAFGIDTHLDLRFWFHSRSVSGGFNYGGYHNTAVDELLDRIAAAEDRRSVLGQLHELQRAVHADQPVLFLWEPRGVVAFRSGLENVRPNELGVVRNLEEWSWR
jgi:peptide/nickel transport system substrate-binding protein